MTSGNSVDCSIELESESGSERERKRIQEREEVMCCCLPYVSVTLEENCLLLSLLTSFQVCVCVCVLNSTPEWNHPFDVGSKKCFHHRVSKLRFENVFFWIGNVHDNERLEGEGW